MATATEARRRVMAVLETASLMLSDLDEVARAWSELPEAERVSWSLDWSNEMSGLERVVRELTPGILTPSEQRRYRDLLNRVKRARPLLDRLGLYAPIVLPEH